MTTYRITAPYLVNGRHNVDGQAIAAEMNKNIADENTDLSAVEAEFHSIPLLDLSIYGIRIITIETEDTP